MRSSRNSLPGLLVLLVLLALGASSRQQAQTPPASPATLDAAACGSPNAPAWCTGSDLGAWVNAADHALGAVPGTIVIGAAGTATTAMDLAAGHSLRIDAPVTLKLSTTLHGSQTVSCAAPAASIASPAIALFVGSTGADEVTIRDCTFLAASSTILSIPAYMTNLSILHNTGTCILFQGNAGKLPGMNYLIEANTSVSCPAPAAVYITQSWDNIRVLGNHFAHENSGAEWFGADAASYPTYAMLTTGAQKNAIFANNTCEDMGATCAWGSGMWRTLMQGNSAEGCGDICFDLEGSADSNIVGNTCHNAVNGCACPGFFSGYHNSVLGNNFVQGKGGSLITIKNNNGDSAHIQDITISNNSLVCTDIPCAVIHNETTLGMVFSGNHVLNARFDNVGIMLQGVIEDNVFDFTTQALPGAGNTVNAGLNIPTQYHSYVTVKNNIINTRSAQAAGTYCINAAQLDATGGDTFFIEGNQCTGPWPGGIYLAGAPSTYFLHNNLLPVLPSAPGSTLYKFGNSTPSGSHD